MSWFHSSPTARSLPAFQLPVPNQLRCGLRDSSHGTSFAESGILLIYRWPVNVQPIRHSWVGPYYTIDKNDPRFIPRSDERARA